MVLFYKKNFLINIILQKKALMQKFELHFPKDIEHKGQKIPGKSVFGFDYPLKMPDLVCELDVLKQSFPHDTELSLRIFKHLYVKYYPSHIWNSYDEIYIKTSMELINNFLDKKPGSDNQFMCLMGPSSVGKCTDPLTPVMLPDGTTKFIRDIKVGDYVLGSDYKPKKVIYTHQGRCPMYKIKQWGASDYIVNENHILSLKMTTDNKGKRCRDCEKGDILNIPIKEYITSSKTFKSIFKGWRPEGPAIFYNEYQNVEYEIPPYILGLWLGDGTSSKAHLTNMDSTIIKEWTDYIKSIGMQTKIAFQKKTKCCTYRAVGLNKRDDTFLNKLRSLNVLSNKHIPKHYLLGSIEERFKLLAGLVDTDGHIITHAKGICEYTSVNRTLIQDIRRLALSLGFKCKKEAIKRVNGKDYYRIYIVGDLSTIPTKLKHGGKGSRNYNTWSIEVEEMGLGDYCGIALEPDNSKDSNLYMHSDFTVTHNTYSGTALYNWLYLMNPTNTKIVLTSTTVESTRQRVWTDFLNRFKDVRRSCPKLLNEKLWKIADSKQNMSLRFVKSDNRCTVMATSLNNERDEAKTIDGLIGIHGVNYYAFVDEATSCSTALHGAKENLANNKICHFQLSGNPNSPHNLLGHTGRPENGYEKHDWDNVDSFRNSFGIHLYYNPLKSPAILDPDPDVRKALAKIKFPTIEKINIAKEKHGESDPFFQRFVLGRIQLTEGDSGIVSERTIELYDCLKPVEFSPYGRFIKVAGFDPSLGYSHSDDSTLVIARIGTCTDGYEKICFGCGDKESLFKLRSDSKSTLPPLYQMVIQVKDICTENYILPEHCVSDLKPLGVRDVIWREWSEKVMIIDGGSKPDKRDSKYESFSAPFNKITQCYLDLKGYMEAGLVGGLPKEIVEYLLARKFLERNGKILLEPKEEFKDRTKMNSPDTLDAIVYALTLAIQRVQFRKQTTKVENVNKKQEDTLLFYKEEEKKNTVKINRFKTSKIRKTSFGKKHF